MTIIHEYGRRIPHIIPIDDIEAHEQSPECWCKPKLQNSILVHNAADLREMIEKGIAKRGQKIYVDNKLLDTKYTVIHE